MDDFLREFISRPHKVKGVTFTFLDALLFVCISVTGVLLRSTVITAYTDVDAYKITGIVCEYLLAVICAAIVFKYTGHRTKSLLTYSILVIYPTFVANGTLMNLNSVFYVILLFMGLYLFISGYRAVGLVSVCLGLAAAAWRFITWHISAGDGITSLTRGWPNVYEIIGGTAFIDLLDRVSLLFMAGLLLTAAYCMVKKKVRPDADLVLDVFVFLSVFIPYFAPFMPAWAGYAADAATLVYFMKRQDRFYLPILHIICSYAAYAYQTNGESKLPMVVYAVILMGIMANLGADLYKDASRKAAVCGDPAVPEKERGV